MDFFTHQENARRKTLQLVSYFAMAVILIVAAVNLAVSGIMLAFLAQRDRPVTLESLWNPPLFLGVSAGTLVVILLGSLYKTAMLRGGGQSVATMLGGRPIDPNTRDLDERVVLNVVEEMAIASGTPVPPVFLLEEGAINAFAAGWSPNDAVIGVTRGAVETLTRDELQGVIAHEFSHILNGDMRTNIRLIGLLHGILFIALIGYLILRSLGGARISSRGDKKGGGGAVLLAILLLGVSFVVIGGIGVFFGRLIQAAVSRQREFLADASAVQFTRNPAGIAGALKKIGGLAAGSRLETARAVEASHLFFGNALRSSFLGLMSTHPPLPVRIQRIEPAFDGVFPEATRQARSARDLHREATQSAREQHVASIRSRSGKSQAEARAASFAFQPDAAVASIGTVSPEKVDYAAALLSTLPERVAEAVREPLGAVTTIYGLLLDEDDAVRNLQLQCIDQGAGLRTVEELQRLQPALNELSPESRLPLVEMAVPALCRLSAAQYRSFCQVIRSLVEADKQIDLFEFALQRLLLRQLAPHHVPQKPRPVQYYSWRPLLPACARLISMLAHVGNRDPQAAEQAFEKAAARIPVSHGAMELRRRNECSLDLLDRTLELLAGASPPIKKAMIEACATCIESDGQVTVEEAELLRIVADSLDCPMPPIMAR